MKRIMVAAFLVALAFAAVGCGMVNTLTGTGNLKTTTDLWSDVPRMDGLASSQMEMPLYAKVLMRTMLNNLGQGKDTGDWIVFSSAKTADDVKNFYTNERMTTNGWTPSQKSTCLNGSDQGISQVGVFCVFEKHTNDKQIGLMIIGGQDDQTKQLDVLFIRVEQVATPTPN